ncbi:MAG: efflux RND transporter permease subunit [Myxococcota bacterium]
MNLTELAHKNRPLVGMVALALMFFGLVSYFALPAREDPKITIREAVITTDYPGLSAERIELLVTKTIEEAVREVSEVEEIRSVSMPGRSIIHVEVFDRYFDLEQIWDDVRKRVERITQELPEGTSKPIVNDDFGDVAVLTAALRAPDFTMGQMFDMGKHLRDRLHGVEGTKRVELLGVQEERIFIELENARMDELGISNQLLAETLRQQNVIRPGGRVDSGTRSFIIQPTGNFRSVDDIEETLIRSPATGQLIPLADIAEVSRSLIDPPDRKVYFNGDRAILLSVAMLDGFSVLDFGHRVRARLTELEQTLPIGYSVDVLTFQPEQVGKAVFGVTWSVLQTLVIVLAVVILFLGVRVGLIVGSIVPGVMLTTLALMNFFDMTLQRMSLATLVIALGLLVDNGIVIAEDFRRRLEDGLDRDQALRTTGKELAVPLLTSTLTTILVFLPLMLAQHVSGEYTRSISLVILISLLSSWVFAMTLTPLLCHRFIKGGNGSNRTGTKRRDLTQRIFDAMTGPYERILRVFLKRRWLFLGAMVGLLAVSLAGMSMVPKRFFPDSDRTQLLAYIDLPAGVSSRTTDAAMERVMKRMDGEEVLSHIRNYATYVGFGGPRFVLSLTPVDPAPNQAVMLFDVDGATHMPESRRGLQRMFDAHFPGMRVQVVPMFLGPSDSTKIEIQVQGPDATTLYQTGAKLESLLAEVPGAWGIKNDWQNRTTTVVVDVDQARARRADVTSADVARSMETFFSGRQATEFREDDDVFPVVLRATSSERHDLDRLRTLVIQSAGSDASVPLEQVAEVRIQNDFGRVHREGLNRTLTVEGRNRMMTAEDMVPIIEPELSRISESLPPGHQIEFDGVVEQSVESQSALMANVPLCIGLIAILLVGQFNSFRRPIIIFSTIPLLLVGAVTGLLALNATFGFMEILGLYSLAGIVINNAIVLIDRIDIERHEGGQDDFEAVVSACVRRLRPIVMTTVTTILGLLPLIIAQDALFYGMASVIAFGLLVGTVLTLGVVPVLFSLLFRIPEPAQTVPQG